MHGGYLSLSNFRNLPASCLSCEARIPNNEVLALFVDSVSLWFKDVLCINIDDNILGSSATLTMDETGAFETTMKKLLSHSVRRVIIDRYNYLFRVIVEGLCVLKAVSHRLSPKELASKAGSWSGSENLSSSVYYPIKGHSNKIVIHQYKILFSGDRFQVDEDVQSTLWQVYVRNDLADVVSTFNDLNNAQQLEIRVFKVYVDKNTPDQSRMETASVLHDIAELTGQWLPLFESMQEKELRKLKTRYRMDEFMNEFRRVGSVQAILERLESTNKAIYELGIAIGDLEIARRILYGG